MSTLPCAAPAVKPGRSLRLLPTEEAAVCVEITQPRGQRRETSRYWIDAIPSDWGRAFLVEKQGDGSQPNEEYHVLIENAQDGSCECLGFLRWGHCKHLAAVRKLLELGQLGGQP